MTAARRFWRSRREFRWTAVERLGVLVSSAVVLQDSWGDSPRGCSRWFVYRVKQRLDVLDGLGHSWLA